MGYWICEISMEGTDREREGVDTIRLKQTDRQTDGCRKGRTQTGISLLMVSGFVKFLWQRKGERERGGYSVIETVRQTKTDRKQDRLWADTLR